jgi:hypothetical protein
VSVSDDKIALVAGIAGDRTLDRDLPVCAAGNADGFEAVGGRGQVERPAGRT